MQVLWGLYRTYEELKQYHRDAVGAINIRFVSYLWGIETYTEEFSNKRRDGLYRTYEELKHIFYRIIVMYI